MHRATENQDFGCVGDIETPTTVKLNDSKVNVSSIFGPPGADSCLQYINNDVKPFVTLIQC